MKKEILILIFLSTSILVGCGKTPDEPRNTYTTEMMFSVAYEPYSKSSLTKDGKAMMPPVNGTIPRGYKPYHYKANDDDAARAGLELKDPFPTTKEMLKEGEKLFASFCLICHGEIGKGDGPLIPKFRNPPSYSSATVSQYPAGRIF
ncbi:MAG: hypothetical protein HQ517_13365, partial [SAR324 cluster bacterium]|nr:hypothetical protein [SAR324 cluster bacterium]